MKQHITGEVSEQIHAPVSRVWEALTKPEIIKKYFFGTDTHTSWKPGTPIRFTGEWQGKPYEDKGTVLDFQPNKLVKYTYWSSMSGMEDRPENYVTVTYTLSGKDNEVTLTITQENIPDEKSKAHSEENWKKVIEGLKKVVEEKAVSSI